MYQKDFILRMIEMIGELIALILGFIKKGDLQQASQAIENAYRDFLKEDASLFRNINKEKLTDELLQKHNYTNGHLRILSELFFAEAELQLAKGNTENSIAYYEKSLILLEFVERESKNFSLELQSKISMIEGKIAKLNDE